MKPSATSFSWDYNRAELIADGIVHAIGIALAVAGAAVLLVITIHTARVAEISSGIVYIVGLLSMLCASAAFNFWPVSPRKWLLRRLDHSAIFLLIAATYTPFVLHIESRMIVGIVLAIVWLAAGAGMMLKLFWPGRFDRLSIGLYLILGWGGILALDPISAVLHPVTLWLLAAGGVLYSVGVVFHVWERLRFHTVIWHGFVVSAACFHYAAVLSSVT